MTRRALLCAAVIVVVCGRLYTPDRPPEKVLLPDGFVGWTRLDYGVPGAPALTRDGAYVVVRYPSDGHLITSSVLTGTYGLREVFYYSGDHLAPAPPGFRATGGFTQWNEKDPQERMSWFAFFGTDADAAVPEPPRTESGVSIGRVVPWRRLLSRVGAHEQSGGRTTMR